MQRKLNRSSLLHFLPVFALAACGGSPTGPDFDGGPAVVAVSSPDTTVPPRRTDPDGHTHTVAVPRSDLGSANAMTYNATASVGHIHMVTLSAAQLAMLNAGGTVTVTSTLPVQEGPPASYSRHTHTFTFTT